MYRASFYYRTGGGTSAYVSVDHYSPSEASRLAYLLRAAFPADSCTSIIVQALDGVGDPC